MEDSLCVAPKEELTLFKNREKFDLVVVYDQSSESLDHSPVPLPASPSLPFTTPVSGTKSPLKVLVDAISPKDEKSTGYPSAKKLRTPPVLLIGGMDAWKKDIGEIGIAKRKEREALHADAGANGSVSITSTLERQHPSSPNASGITNVSPTSLDAYQVWTPKPRSETNAPLLSIRDIAPAKFFSDTDSASPRLVFVLFWLAVDIQLALSGLLDHQPAYLQRSAQLWQTLRHRQRD